jgi:peptidoglycan hydrolase-like protein with peptidoglycan-binding domain
LTLATVVALLVGGAYWAGTKATSPAALARHNAAAPRTVLTSPVVLRRLTEALTVQGVVGPAQIQNVDFGPVTVAGAQPIVTQPPLRRGSVIANGSLVAQVAGRPVFALAGSTPMYRELTLGDQGADVAQLQDDLAALGFLSSDQSGVFGSSTMLAVRAFYRGAGYSLPALPGGTPKHPDRVVPQAEVVFVPHLPAALLKSSLVLGQPVTNPALVLAEGQLRAVVSLTTAQGALVQVGDAATLYIPGPNGGATAVAARVRVVQGTGSGTVAVLKPRGQLGIALIGAHVTASIVIASTRAAALAVPVAAVYTAANGQTLVTVIGHGRRVNLPVRVGAEIGGYVPVTPIGGQLAAGDQVVVGQ